MSRIGKSTDFSFPGGTSDKEPRLRMQEKQRCRVNSRVGKIPWRRKWQPTPVSCLASYIVHRVTKSRTPQRLKVDESLAGARGGRDREYYLMATGFPSEVMRKFWMQTVLMVAQQLICCKSLNYMH